LGKDTTMGAPLTVFETDMLNKIIPTQTFGTPYNLKMAIRNLVVAEKENLKAKENITDQDFNVLISNTGANIFQFLRDNEFYYEREGSVFYLTEKGKHLRTQGSLGKYIEWREQQRIKNAAEMKQIENNGYLAEKQSIYDKKPEVVKKKRFGFF
jgi:predicted transcriptional regulator